MLYLFYIHFRSSGVVAINDVIIQVGDVKVINRESLRDSMTYADFLQLIKYSPRPLTIRFAKPNRMLSDIEAEGLPVKKVVLQSLDIDKAPRHFSFDNTAPNPTILFPTTPSPKDISPRVNRVTIFSEALIQTGKSGRFLEIQEDIIRKLSFSGIPDSQGFRGQIWMMLLGYIYIYVCVFVYVCVYVLVNIFLK